MGTLLISSCPESVDVPWPLSSEGVAVVVLSFVFSLMCRVVVGVGVPWLPSLDAVVTAVLVRFVSAFSCVADVGVLWLFSSDELLGGVGLRLRSDSLLRRSDRVAAAGGERGEGGVIINHIWFYCALSTARRSELKAA